MDPITIAPVPTPLSWGIAPASWSLADGSALTIAAGAETDMFIDPQGTATTLNAPRLVGDLAGDFLLSARVTVDFAATYDAGVLLLYAGDRTWAKLCFEFSPQRQPMVVSVVTRGLSDDSNSFVVDGNQVWLRVARLGQAFAFHAATDGASWQFVRHFSLDVAGPIAAGFVTQSPTGAGCSATFDQIGFAAQRLGDLRNGE